ncbi:hypothetical protein LCGC14_1613600 [marine sediment metagenome]|uniref:PIN domain-containing protein n=1 Tax=marine sediment metagenome TaxID=412755 RepID=A0A0F9I7K3_9ZZZZ
MFLDTSGLFAFLIKNEDKHSSASSMIQKTVMEGAFTRLF